MRGGLPRCAAWAESIGGLEALCARADANARVLFDWTERTPWVENLALDPATRSNTSVCLKIVDAAVAAAIDARAFVKQLEAILDKENAARDIAGHRDAPPSCASGAARRSRRPIWRH